MKVGTQRRRSRVPVKNRVLPPPARASRSGGLSGAAWRHGTLVRSGARPLPTPSVVALQPVECITAHRPAPFSLGRLETSAGLRAQRNPSIGRVYSGRSGSRSTRVSMPAKPASHLADVPHGHRLDAVPVLNDLESLAGLEAERFPHDLRNDPWNFGEIFTWSMMTLPRIDQRIANASPTPRASADARTAECGGGLLLRDVQAGLAGWLSRAECVPCRGRRARRAWSPIGRRVLQ